MKILNNLIKYEAFPEEGGKRCNDKILFVGMVLSSLFKLWLVNAHDLVATYTPHDDYLFVRQAREILSGHWFGAYDHLLLIKGPVYPLFIAFSHLLDIPLLLSQHLLYIVASFFMIYAIKPISQKTWLLLFVFLLVLYNPHTYNYPGSARVFRLGLTMPLVLILFSAMIGTLLRLHEEKYVALLVISGISFTLLYYTREEGIWLIPCVILFAVMFVLFNNEFSFQSIVKRGVFLLIPCAIFLLSSSLFLSLNKHYYGVRTIVEIKSPEFQKALGGLMSIATERNPRHVPVSRVNESTAFSVSPTFQRLQTIRENQRGGLPASFYIWTFRDAAAAGGYTKTLPDALQFYKQIGDELETACKNEQIKCLKRRFSIRPVWYKDYWEYVIPEFFSILYTAFSFPSYYKDDHGYEHWKTTAKAWMIDDYRFVTKEKLAPAKRIQVAKIPKYVAHMIVEKFRVLNDMVSFYQVFCLIFFPLTVVVFFIFGIRDLSRGRSSYLFLLSFLLLGGIFSLISVLTFVSITLWPITRPLTSSYPLIFLYIGMGILFLGNRININVSWEQYDSCINHD